MPFFWPSAGSGCGERLDHRGLRVLASLLLALFAAGERFCRCAFDHEADAPVEPEIEDAPGDAALLLDGLFLHRRALRTWWDLSILLDVPPAVAAERMLLRDGQPARRRYVRGQELYFADAEPAKQASLVLPWPRAERRVLHSRNA